MTMPLDPIALSLLRRIDEAEDDVDAILDLPLDVRKGVAFPDGFVRIGIRDELVREFARHLTFIPCAGISTKEYEAAKWAQRDMQAHKIVILVRRMLGSGS